MYNILNIICIVGIVAALGYFTYVMTKNCHYKSDDKKKCKCSK